MRDNLREEGMSSN